MPATTYHIIWTTYGTWLPGDSRGWVKRGKLGVRRPDPGLARRSADSMADEAVVLSIDQRRLVEDTIRRHCDIRGWTLHAVNARSNHVHVVVTADRSAE